MDKFNEGKYSLEDARNEAEKIRQKVGRDNASPSEYKKAEQQVEIENKAVLSAPISAETKARVEEAYNRVGNVDAEIRKRIDEMREKLREELGKEAEDNLRKIQLEVGAEWREKIGKWLKDIYEGKYGRGELAVAQVYEEGETSYQKVAKLLRVIPIKNPTQKISFYTAKAANKAIAELVVDGFISGVYRLYSPSTFHEKIEECKTDSDIEQFLLKHEFAEVNYAGTTEEELDILYRKLIERRWTISYILHVFPKDYKLKVKVGEILNFGGCFHHSGEIKGKQIVLPTGRLAVVSRYSGEREDFYGRDRFWGVLTDPSVDPDWSAKGGYWSGPQLDEPTPEEIAFLKGADVEFPNEKSLGDRKKMLEFGEEESE